VTGGVGFGFGCPAEVAAEGGGGLVVANRRKTRAALRIFQQDYVWARFGPRHEWENKMKTETTKESNLLAMVPGVTPF
jgi:hypothetical protein